MNYPQPQQTRKDGDSESYWVPGDATRDLWHVLGGMRTDGSQHIHEMKES